MISNLKLVPHINMLQNFVQNLQQPKKKPSVLSWAQYGVLWLFCKETEQEDNSNLDCMRCTALVPMTKTEALRRVGTSSKFSQGGGGGRCLIKLHQERSATSIWNFNTRG